MKNKKLILAFLVVDLLVAFAFFAWLFWLKDNPAPLAFDSERALQDVVNQVALGPRVPGSDAHQKAQDYIQQELKSAGWQSKVFKQDINGHTAYNILAIRSGAPPTILLGAHYDSRIQADQDPTPANHLQAVPGANDGASGVALLLGIARGLPVTSTPCALLFIDIEDNGNLPGWDWIQGSTSFAADISFRPKAVVIVDMIGDRDLNIYKEKNSDPELTRQIWKTAKNLGYESTFISDYKYEVLDDHLPFIKKGLRAVDIIDLDYKYWHTTQDTPDKVSAASLEKVGQTLLVWIQNYGACLQQGNCNEK
jgi:hypothetical protein